MPRVKVQLGKRSYPVVIGNEIGSAVHVELTKRASRGRVFALIDPQVHVLHGKYLNGCFGGPEGASQLVIGSGEKAKSQSEVTRIQDYLLSEKVSRSDFVLACGGGITSDIAGYAAATTLRGLDWGIVSTTLLGMVDAAIGGKTGVNHKTGKNLIGAFHQPSFVACDIAHLRTLPAREFIAGMGEIAKYAGLVGLTLLSNFRKYLSKGNLADDNTLVRLIKQSVEYKAMIVAEDEREIGVRKVLNLGHTFGHAIEKSLGYGRLRHGEAVIIGLLCAVELSCLLNRSARKRLSNYRESLVSLLRYVPRRKLDLDDIVDSMGMDKKRVGGKLSFILLDRPGKPIISDAVKPPLVRESLVRAADAYKAYGGNHA